MVVTLVLKERNYKDMSILDDQIEDWLRKDPFDMDDNDCEPLYDRILLGELQKPKTLGGVDWRYEKGGVFYND